MTTTTTTGDDAAENMQCDNNIKVISIWIWIQIVMITAFACAEALTELTSKENTTSKSMYKYDGAEKTE